MKKTKVLVPALGVLCLGMAAAVSGTVAWYSANDRVQADGMTVQAKVATNLYIENGLTNEIDAINKTSVSLTYTSTSMSPATLSFATNTLTVQEAATFNTKPTPSTPGSAATYTNIGTYTGAANAINAAKAGEPELSSYVGYDPVSVVRKAADATNSMSLKVDATVSGASAEIYKCFRLGFMWSIDGGANWKWKALEAVNPDKGTISWTSQSIMDAVTVNDNTATEIGVFAWFDGENEFCTANNAIGVNQATINLTFHA